LSNKKESGSNGNQDREDEEASKKIDEFIAENSKFVSAKEFEGEGKVFEILKVEPGAKGKFGPVVQFLVKEPNSTRERIWNASSTGALLAVNTLLKKGVKVQRIRKTGLGSDTKYFAEAAS
jgi:hypothetical protein